MNAIRNFGCQRIWLAPCTLLIAAATFAEHARASGPITAESVLLRLVDVVDVPANTTGVLAEVNVVEGQTVTAGQLLARVDDFESDLLLKRAELELQLTKMQIDNDISIQTAQTDQVFATQSYLRMKKAADSLSGSVSISELAKLELEMRRTVLAMEDAKRTLQLAKAMQFVKENDVQSMRRRVEIRRVVAPIEGTVEQVMHKAGEWVEPGEKVVRVISLRRVRAEGFVNIMDVEGDMIGWRVKLRLKGNDDQERIFAGKITFVHTEVDPVNGRMRVWAEIDNPKRLLRPGMRARMLIYPPATDRSEP